MFRMDDVHLKPPVKNEIKELTDAVAGKLGISEAHISRIEIIKRSLDARKKSYIKYVYSVAFELVAVGKGLEIAQKQSRRGSTLQLYKRPTHTVNEVLLRDLNREMRPLVVGSGPAGLFCAYFLARAGIKPILVERGERVEKRSRTVDAFWNGGELNPESNVQFGEGGAGTFSDGKLYSGNNDKEGIHYEILRTFVEFGADPDILYDAHPHIGTDVLKKVVANLRGRLEMMGAEIHFETRFIKPVLDSHRRAVGAELMEKGKISVQKCGCIILCTGHSARDTFKNLYECGLDMEAKSFAVGLRVQHLQKMINISQYGAGYEKLKLPPADYKLVSKSASGRGVYSFCMCPGGYVVNASSEAGALAVNGMSYQGRAGDNANSAIIVTVGPEIFGEGVFGGMEFQKKLEKAAFELAGGRIPIQSLGDYRKKNGSCEHRGIDPAIKGTFRYAVLNGLLPEELENDIIGAFDTFGHTIEGFDDPDAVLAGIESRTSSPVRILRDESGQSNIRGIFPCGEGAGYAGGITSAAADGIRTAEKVVKYTQRLII